MAVRLSGRRCSLGARLCLLRCVVCAGSHLGWLVDPNVCAGWRVQWEWSDRGSRGGRWLEAGGWSCDVVLGLGERVARGEASSDVWGGGAASVGVGQID